MKLSYDLLIGGFSGLILGFTIFFFLFNNLVSVNVYTCYTNRPVLGSGGPFCYEGAGGSPCFGAIEVVNETGLVSYSDVSPYLVQQKQDLKVSFT